jgi:hypothetical protein
MGKYFKEFCDKQRKLRNGHVRDVIDMEECDKDKAAMAFMSDSGMRATVDIYPSMSNEWKNECYQSCEWIIRNMIDRYNQGVDLDKELAGDTQLCADEIDL